MPAEIVYAILDGVNALKVWREYLGLSQQETARLAGVGGERWLLSGCRACRGSRSTFARTSGGKRKGSVGVMRRLAGVLGVDLEFLLPL